MTDDAGPALPLAGVRILDLSRYAPGLFASRLLADLGAEVVSVEAPRDAESDLPLYPTGAARAAGTNPLFRHRRSIALDLRRPAGLEIVLDLIERSDVVIEGFRPGVADRIGVGFEAARTRNPAIVYCSVTGYGQRGDQAGRPGHDLNYVAESGLLSHIARGQEAPGIPSNFAADLAGGSLAAAFGIAAALHGARQGVAQYVDVSMVRTIMTMLSLLAGMQQVGNPDPAGGGGLLNGAAPFYRTYRTSDGAFIAVGALEPKFYQELCTRLGREDLIPLHLDVTAWPRMHAELAEIFASGTREHWSELLAAAAVTPVLTTSEAFARAGEIVTDGEPSRMRLFPGPAPADDRYSARRGSDTVAVLGELGRSRDDIDALLADGVVAAAVEAAD